MRRLALLTRLALVALVALLFASGCSLAQALQMPSATPRQRETVYAVLGPFAVTAVVPGMLAGAPAEDPATQPTQPTPRGPLLGP